MVKKGLQNYFKSLKYFFTPLGTMFLGMMIGFSVIIPSIISSANNMIAGITELSNNVSLDFNVLFEHLWEMVLALDWNDPPTALSTLISAEWLNNALTQTLTTILGVDFETFKTQIVTLVNVFLNEVVANVLMFFIWWILGFVVGIAFTRFLVRRNIAKRSLWKFVLFTLINSVLSGAYAFAMVLLAAVWQTSVVIMIILALLLVGFFAFFEAYLLYGVKKVRVKQIVNVKNIGAYTLTSFLIYAITVAITLLVWQASGILGFFVGLSLLVVSGHVISMNAESYVKEKVDEIILQNAADTDASHTEAVETRAVAEEKTEGAADEDIDVEAFVADKTDEAEDGKDENRD